MLIFKKTAKIIFFVALLLLFVDWTFRQAGYPMMDYEYNCYYNLTHNRTIDTKSYRVSMPLFTWRVIKEDNGEVELYGLLTKNGNLNAIFKEEFAHEDFEFVENMCQMPEIISSKNSLEKYDIFCNKASSSLKSLEPFRIYWVKNKVFAFFPNYQNEFKKEYDDLINNIKIK